MATHNFRQQKNFPMYHAVQRGQDNTVVILGCNPDVEMKAGDTMLMPQRTANSPAQSYEIVTVERKNHQGVFKDPKLAEMSHFKAICK